MKNINGLHHITAISEDARKNFEFYSKILGLRFVKRTVNFDDPTSYHFYFGDKTGTPGTLLTFFIWPQAHKGRLGVGVVNSISFRVREEALGFWLHRFVEKGIKHEAIAEKFGEKYISFVDPDGMVLELIGDKNAKNANWNTDDISVENAIIDIYGVGILEKDYEITADILTQNLDYKFEKNEGNIYRYTNNQTFIDITNASGFWEGVVGVGNVHHIAFSTKDMESELKVRESLVPKNLHPTEQIDRNYFYSVYFREPGGVLFEIATEGPGFLVDESEEELGKSLKLPKQYEIYREEFEGRLERFD